MQVQDDDKPYDDINITPMLDLAYVLLIIFIIMTTASVQGIKVDLPKAKSSASLAKPKTKAITVADSGQVFLDAYPVTMDEFREPAAHREGDQSGFSDRAEGRRGRAVPEGDGRARPAAPPRSVAGRSRDRQGEAGRLTRWK